MMITAAVMPGIVEIVILSASQQVIFFGRKIDQSLGQFPCQLKTNVNITRQGITLCCRGGVPA